LTALKLLVGLEPAAQFP